MGKPWTTDQVEALRQRILAGETMAQMAAAYGKTTAAMNATLTRFRKSHGLPKLADVVIERPAPPFEPDPPPVAAPEPQAPPAPPVEEPPAEPTNYATLMDRTGCCWAMEGAGANILFCNAPRAPGAQYCATHAARKVTKAGLVPRVYVRNPLTALTRA